MRKVHTKQLETAEREKWEIEASCTEESGARQRLEQRADSADAPRKSQRDLDALRLDFRAFRRERDGEIEDLERDKKALVEAGSGWVRRRAS